MKAVRRARPFRVAICFDRAQKYSDQILKGIAKYINIHGPWICDMEPRFFGQYKSNWLKNWPGDGLLAYVEDLRLARYLIGLKMPVVEVFGHRYDLGLPQISPDGRASGRLAALHLIERQFKTFAFCGYERQAWSEHRQAGFVATLEQAGFSPLVHLASRPSHTLDLADAIQQNINDWIRIIPLPIGIMVCSDRHAQRVLSACRSAGICVPEEAAIIGSGNDEDFCHFSQPPLSSVVYDTERIGFEAAKKLHEIMRNRKKRARPTTTFIPPLGIATRRSTDILAVPDQLIAKMSSYIRHHALEGIAAKELLSEFRVSRSTCYRRFTAVLGRTPHEEILRVRMERAKGLLSETDLPLKKIAEMAGFQNTEYFFVVFRRRFGMTPSQHRKQRKAVR